MDMTWVQAGNALEGLFADLLGIDAQPAGTGCSGMKNAGGYAKQANPQVTAAQEGHMGGSGGTLALVWVNKSKPRRTNTVRPDLILVT